MATEVTIEYLMKKKCPICGDQHKSFSAIHVGQVHIATVSVCCNCGLTLTFSHSASEYAKFLATGDFIPPEDNGMCHELHCSNRVGCPRIEKGRKI